MQNENSESQKSIQDISWYLILLHRIQSVWDDFLNPIIWKIEVYLTLFSFNGNKWKENVPSRGKWNCIKIFIENEKYWK